MEKLLNYEPKKVMTYFNEISKIPRGSGNEKAVSDYIYTLAKEKGWDVVQDEIFNLIIKKKGTIDYENSNPVILQGHLDMVCVKEEWSNHDFLKDSLQLVLKGDDLYANGTTLGADNGIAVAMALGILDSDDIPHPPLEVIFTVDEESGMSGAEHIDLSTLNGRTLINLDSEELGVFTVGSAGGAKCKVNVSKNVKAINSSKGFRISVKGLQGGHSGVEIQFERGNAIKLLNRLMMSLKEFCDFTSINGGDFDNAIPVEASVVVVTEDVSKLKKMVDEFNLIYKAELKVNDPLVNVTLEEVEPVDTVYSEEMTRQLMASIAMIPSGVIEKSTEIDLVITSCNLGVIRDEEDRVQMIFAPRSSVDNKLRHLVDGLGLIADSIGVELEKGGFYPGWAFDSSSNILNVCKRVYEKMNNQTPLVGAIHAGLECGFFLGKIDGLDAISIGPEMAEIHTPNEHLNLPSVKELYDFVLEVLKELK